MKEVFFKNIFLLLIVNIIVKPFWIFGIDLQVQNTLGEEAYGHYFALLNISLIYQIILDLGLQTYSTQRLARHAQRFQWLFPNIMVAKLVLAGIYFIALLIAAQLLDIQGASFYLLLLLGLAQTMNSLLLYFRSCIVSLHQYRTESILSVLDKAIMIVLGIGLLYTSWATNFSIKNFIIIQIIAYTFSAIVAWILLKKYVSFDNFHVDYSKTLRIIQKGIPYAILVFIMSIYFKGDSIILERLNMDNDPIQAGKYAAVYRLLDAANNFSGVLIAGMIIPMFAKNMLDKQYTNGIIQAATQLLLVISLLACIVTYYYGEDIMQWLYKGYDAGDGKLLGLLFIAFPLFCLNYVYSSYLTARGDIKYMIGIVSCAAIISILGNLLFSATYGAMATVLTCIISHGLAALLFIIRTYRFMPFQFKMSITIKFIVYTLLLTSIGFLMQGLTLSFLLQIGILLLLAAISSIGLKLIPIHFLKSKNNSL